MAIKGYGSGNDILVIVGGKAVGHCTSTKISTKSETKSRSVKPLASEPSGTGLWKENTVTGLSISISASGLRYVGETESDVAAYMNAIKASGTVDIEVKSRGATAAFIAGKFVIESLEQDENAGEDGTYSVSLVNSGMPTTYDGTKLNTPG